jgi:hypothetical protein
MRLGLVLAVVAVCEMFGLAGCSGGAFSGLDQASTSGEVAGAKLTGSVHGGQQPIVGAHVYLFAAGTTGYGGAGITASALNASVPLLTSGSGTTLDSGGGATNGDYYVTTDANGGFTITGDYTCAVGSQVYLYALGGNPGAGVNSAAGLMAVLGNCPAAGNFATATPFVMVNEVSTVAAAYAFAGFATDATHVASSGTALAQTGIANAFANAGNLVTLSTGTALATTPAGNGAPQATTNMVADILASCVNTNGTGSACTKLFANAKSGGTTGTVATDTATAAINMVHNQFSSGVPALYALSTANPPFLPVPTTAPPDFASGWTYFFLPSSNNAQAIAIDALGNAWFTAHPLNSASNSALYEISSSGAFVSPSGGYTGGGLNSPGALAIDGLGNVWVVNANNSVTKFSSTGTILSGANGYTGGGLHSPTGIAIDGSGNAWITNFVGVTELSSTGFVLSGTSGYASSVFEPGGIAIDGSGNAWIGGGSVNKLSSSGSILSGANGFTGGGVDGAYGIALDASGNAWVTNYYSYVLSKFSNSGVALSGSGFTGGSSSVSSVAIDGAGNVWAAGVGGSDVNESSPSGSFMNTVDINAIAAAIDGSGNLWAAYYGFVVEYLDVATPVITPISAGLPVTPTADGSSKLGTRP